MTMDKNFNKIKDVVDRKKSKESQETGELFKKEILPAISVEAIEMIKTNESSMNEKGILETMDKHLLEQIYKEKEAIRDKIRLWDVLCEKTTVERLGDWVQKDKTEKYTSEKLGALLLRCRRFRIKYGTLLMINLMHKPFPMPIVERRLQEIKRTLEKKEYIMKSTTDFKVEIERTIKGMVNELKTAEWELKELISMLHFSWRIPQGPYLSLEIISRLLYDHVGFGFTGIPPDNYFVVDIMYNSSTYKFNDEQRKQIAQYIVEIEQVMGFYMVNAGMEIGNVKMYLKQTRYIFKKASELKEEEFTNNRFRIIIKVMETFIEELYANVLYYYSLKNKV